MRNSTCYSKSHTIHYTCIPIYLYSAYILFSGTYRVEHVVVQPKPVGKEMNDKSVRISVFKIFSFILSNGRRSSFRFFSY